MAFEDVFGNGDMSGTADLARQLFEASQPDDGQPVSSDPVELTQRLSRKLAVTPSRVGGVDFDKVVEEKKPKAQKAPDLSSFGETPPEPSNDDLSSFGEEVKAPEPKPGVLATLGGEGKALGKGLVRGAPEAVGSMMQGAAALTKAKPVSPEGMALVDELGNSGSLSASERAKLMGRALRTIGDRGLQMDFNAALQRIARGGDAAAEAQAIRDKFGIQNQKAAVPTEETPLYQAGKATKDWIDKTVPMTDAEKDSIGGRVGTGVSAMAPYLAAGVLVGPEAGLVLGAAGMGAQTAGDTFQAAKAKGATDDQAATAAGWSGAISAVLGTLPLGSVFAPVSQAAPGMKAWLAAKLVQAARSGTVFTTVGEAQEFLLQQVAKEQYDPKAGYSPDAKRVISGLITGGVLGTLHPLTPKPSDLSSPDDIAAFLRRASRANGGTGRTPEEEEAFQRGASTRADIDEFLRQKEQQEAAARPQLPAPEENPPESSTSGEPETKPSPTGGEAVGNVEATEREGLKRYGWSDDEIAAMSPAQRRAEFQSAMGTGASEKPATESDVAANPVPGTREAPIRPETGADVFHAQPAEPTPAQASAENYQHAHMELEHLGLVGRNSISIETGAGQVRRSVDEDGTVHENTMPFPYGRIKGTKGADGEPLDIMVGPNPKSPHVFVIDQHKNDGSGFDEHKIQAGFDTPQEALIAYGAAYDDLGGNRIGHVTAMTPEQFIEWRKGDTTQPLKKSLSEEEIGNLFDEIVEGTSAQEGGEPSKPSANGELQEKGSPQLLGAASDGGRSPQHPGAESAKHGRSEPREGDVILPGKLYAEPTEAHHQEIEAVLGEDYHRVLPVDVARAAEILAENPGIRAPLAFQYAVIENAAAQKFLTLQQLEQAYGPEVKALLEPGRERPSISSEPVEQERTTIEQEPTSGGEESGVVPRGGKNGAPERAEGAAAENGEQPNAAGGKPNTKRQARGAATKEGGARPKGAEAADKSGREVADEKLTGLGPVDRYNAIQNEASRRYPGTSETDKKGKVTKYISHEHIAFDNGAQGYEWHAAMPIHRTEAEMAEAYEAGRRWAEERGVAPKTRVSEHVERARAQTNKINAREAEREKAAFAKLEAEQRAPSEPDLLTADHAVWEKGIWDALNKAWDSGKLDPKYRRSYRFRDGHIERYDGKKAGKERWFKQATFELGRIAQQLGLPTDLDRSKAKSDTEFKAAPLVDHFVDHLRTQGFRSIIEARKFAKDAKGEADPKVVEEAIEAAVVRIARDLIDQGWGFPELVSLYERQPKLGTRTSTSIRDQAYSTPVPLAYVADRLAGVTRDVTVYEPTAGNGALLIAADPKKAVANEINPARNAALVSQGFKTLSADAAERQFASKAFSANGGNRFDVVIANPPFGPVREGDQSKVFDLSHIQPGYKTTEIDHAIALEALRTMKDDGHAALIVGGLNKQLRGDEARSAGYNAKAKREFYKTLYDNYNVTDHFTVAGELYERQGAGWPVDVIVINGRGKSARALPAVDVPRIFDSWESLGGLLNGETGAANAGAVGQQAGGAPEGRPGLAGGGLGNRGGARPSGAAGGNGQVKPGGVRVEPVSGQPENVEAGGAGDQTQGGHLQDQPAAGSDLQSPAGEQSQRLSADEIGDIFDELVPEEKPASKPAAKPDTRPTGEVAKSAVKNATSAADEALSGLTTLFGGGKTIGSGLNFDEETYAKAKPLFIAAAEKFAESKADIRTLMQRMIQHLKDAFNWTTDMLRNARPYVVRFIQDVQDGVVNLLKPEAEAPKPEAPKAAEPKPSESAGQVVYEPQSKTPGLQTLVPVNMKKATSDALVALEKRVGPIDDFVAKELGYDKSQLENFFGAEQVDALGLAIDNLNQGKGFIIGDQTGIGKGRVNAAIIKWAMKKGRIPIFTTMMPDLYADIFRDMTDIGMKSPRILATNAALDLNLDEDGNFKIKTSDTTKHNQLLTSLRTPEEFKKKYDMVVTTYAQMQTLKGEDTARRAFLSAIIPDSTILFDESHNAGGQLASEKRKGKNVVPGRASFARDLVKRANGVFYSSATYAKRPDVMDLYAATDMAMAVDDISKLGEAIAKGGIPMQQVVAAQLSKAGQYIRRERSFEGINYNTPSVQVDHDTYDQISYSLAAIQDFSKIVKEVARGISEEIKAEAGALGHDNAVGTSGASSTNFTSVMHNLINQMLLAMKATNASQMAIEAIRRGEKPVLTVANTMESFLKDYADDLGLKAGDNIDADFSDVLRRYLDRTRRISIKKPFSDKPVVHHVLTDEELGPKGIEAYENAKSLIAAMDLSHLPVSPIDYLKAQIEKAGYKIGEITGRELTVDYSGNQPVLAKRPGGERTTKGKNKTRTLFNTRPEKGGHHAIVINQSGSTGVSMHANARFDDKSKRRMMIVQPEANIDTHMQLLGRVNRTGQVVLPEYDQLVADAPAEKRPAAVLAKKMASLNANTTAARTSAVTAKDVPDFMNEYGDKVAAAFIADNPELNERLGEPFSIGESGKVESEDAMRKLTGRIPLLPLAEQERMYEVLEEEYDGLIKQLESSGSSPLEAKTLDLKARTLETSEVQGPKNNSGSPFAAPVNVEKVSIVRQGKPFTPTELINRIGQSIDPDVTEMGKNFTPEMLAKQLDSINHSYNPLGKRVHDAERTERTTKVNEFEAYVRPLIEKAEDAKKQEAERAKFNAIKDRWTAMHSMLPIGARVRLNMYDGTKVGVVLDVKQTGEPKNPLALGSWKATFAVADASRQVTLPFSRLHLQGQADPESMLDVEVVPTNERAADTLARFELMQSGAREERYIATGNLLAAYDWLNMKGAIINYTDSQGAVHQGILTAKDFKLGDHAIKKGRIVADPAELKTLLDQNQTVWSKDRQVNLSRADRWSDNYQIQAEKKKATGGRYYLDKQLTALTGDFYSRGGMMTASVPGRDLAAAIKRMQEIGAQFTVAAAAPKAQKVESPEPPPDDEPPSGGAGLASLADRGRSESKLLGLDQPKMQALQAKLNEIVKRVAGPGFDTEFNLGMMRDSGVTPGYGSDIKPGGAAAGMYMLDEPLIRLALAGTETEMRTAAYHESYHAIEDKLATDTERRLMEQETPRLREWIKGKTRLNDYRVDQLAGYEVRAIAFQLYAAERDAGKPQAGSGIHIMLRRFFDRLHDLIRQIGNAFRGYGLKTYKDVFGRAYEGGFAEREHGPGAIDANSLAARADMFRSPDPAGPLREVMNQSVQNKIIERFQNHNEGVQRLQDAVQARMEGEIPDSKAFYQKKRLFPGKVATEVQDFNKNHLDPLVDLLKEKGLTLDQVGDIVYAQHAAERNAYIDTINPDMRGMGSGMSDDEAQAILDRYSTRDLAEIANKVDGIRDFILDTMVRSGLESRTTTDAWRAQYQHYVPLGGFAEPREDEETFRESGKFNVRGREVKQAFGRASKADNPLVNLLDQAYRTIERAKKNEYVRSLYLALAGLDPEDRKGFVMFDRGKPRREIDPRTGLVRWVDDSSYRFSPKAVAYKVGGRTHYMVFEKQAVADVLRRMHPDALNGVGQALLTFQNKLKAAWTHYSPEFLIRHFLFRYPIEGTLNSFEQGGSNVPRYMRDTIPVLGRATQAIFASTRGQIHDDIYVGRLQQYWEEMRQAGGAISFRQMRDIDMTRDHLDRRLQSLTGRPIATVRDKARVIAEAMDTVTNAMDNSLRLAAYATARQQGKTPEQASIIARDATVDYQQSGKWKNYLSLIWPFTNVAAQTGARMVSAMMRSRTMRRVFGASVAAGFMSAMFNYLIGGDDKDGVPFFDKMPWWQKQLHLTVLNPFHLDDKGRPVPIHIPLPYNWAFPFTIGQAMGTMAFSSTRGEKRKAIAAAVKSGISAFSPFAEDENMVAAFAPELAKTPVHVYTNENWTGYPVHLDPAYQKGPKSESGFKTTGEGWKFAARMANAASGGDKNHAGALDFFPEDLREMVEYYTGGGTLTKMALNTKNAVEAAASGQPTNYSKLPLARVVMGTDYDASDRARRQEHRREEKRPWEKQH